MPARFRNRSKPRGKWWVLMAKRRMPTRAQESIAHAARGRWNKGTSGLGKRSVSGRKRVPSPAPRMKA